ncbi:hypothetical protein BH24ACT26_BH24ACT26_20950 [soil metagenome]
MTRRCTIILPLLLLGLLAPAAPASAQQMDARDRPRVTGPLTQRAKDCERKKERFRGHVIAVARSCVRFYALRSSDETNLARDYGAVWLQTTVDSRGAWCTTSVKSDIDVPAGTVRHGRAPQAFRTDGRRPVETRLRVDAQGHAAENGVLAKRFTLIRRSLTGDLRGNGSVWRAVWRGSSKSAVASASGIEVSWPSADRPPSPVTSSLRYQLQKKGTC